MRANLQQDLSLTKNQYNNFQKLQYFGLVSRNKEGWIPTKMGVDFIYGDICVVNRVMKIGKEVVSILHPERQKKKSKPEAIHIQDISEKLYKRKEDYIQDNQSIAQKPLISLTD